MEKSIFRQAVRVRHDVDRVTTCVASAAIREWPCAEIRRPAWTREDEKADNLSAEEQKRNIYIYIYIYIYTAPEIKRVSVARL